MQRIRSGCSESRRFAVDGLGPQSAEIVHPTLPAGGGLFAWHTLTLMTQQSPTGGLVIGPARAWYGTLRDADDSLANAVLMVHAYDQTA